jgi:DNA mismatch repair protein MutL
MNHIKILSEDLANKIAAGEVVERPSSIVKELIENALDAGATSLEVEVKNGGRSLIRIVDNGCGIPKDELELAFTRHGTSKISSVEDLHAIGSFGFRGEALPSIASIARVSMTTRVPKASVGASIQIEGGKLMGVKECPSAPGTIVEIKDLFFNTPARRKFLRTDTTELGHITDVVSNFALSHPEVRLIYKSNDKTMLDLPVANSLIDRAEAVLGSDIAPHLVEIKGEENGLKIHGVIGKPHAARSNRTGQTFYINRRWIKSISMSYGLQAGYHGLLMHGQYPVAVIFFDVDLASVDVNVHPTKQEVRLSRESEIKSLLKRTIAEALGQTRDLSPDLKPFAPKASLASQAYKMPEYRDQPKRDPISLYAQEIEARRGDSKSDTEVSEPEAKPYHVPVSEGVEFSDAVMIRDDLQITKILGQIHNTFIIAETTEGFVIIDQHAAHERIMYEQIMAEMKNGIPTRQSLLMDEILELHDRQLEFMEQSLPLLEKIGFEVEPFGDASYVVRAYPAALKIDNPVLYLKSYIEEVEAGKARTTLDNGVEDVAALIACKSRSVKAHDALGPVQLKALVERLGRCENPFACPHGRPTFFKRSFGELEREFKRKV